MTLTLTKQKQAFETFVRIDENARSNIYCRNLSNALFKLLDNKKRFLEACYFIHKNPKKGVTKKFMDILKQMHSNAFKNKSIEEFYIKQKTNTPKIFCPKCTNKPTKISKGYFRCEGCKINFWYYDDVGIRFEQRRYSDSK